MSQDAGAEVKRGVYLGGGKVSYKASRSAPSTTIRTTSSSIFYAESSYKFSLTDKLGLFLRPVTDQRSVGIGPVEGYAFKTNPIWIQSRRRAMEGASSASPIRQTPRGRPAEPLERLSGLHQRQVKDFNRAGENVYSQASLRLHASGGSKASPRMPSFVHGWGRKDRHRGVGYERE